MSYYDRTKTYAESGAEITMAGDLKMELSERQRKQEKKRDDKGLTGLAKAINHRAKRVKSQAASEYNEKREFDLRVAKNWGYKRIVVFSAKPMCPIKALNVKGWFKTSASGNLWACRETAVLLLNLFKRGYYTVPQPAFGKDADAKPEPISMWIGSFEVGDANPVFWDLKEGFEAGPLVGMANVTWKDLVGRGNVPKYTIGDTVIVFDNVCETVMDVFRMDPDDWIVNGVKGWPFKLMERVINNTVGCTGKKEVRRVLQKDLSLVPVDPNNGYYAALCRMWNKLIHSINGNIFALVADMTAQTVTVNGVSYILIASDSYPDNQLYVPRNNECILEAVNIAAENFSLIEVNGVRSWFPKTKEVMAAVQKFMPVSEFKATYGAVNGALKQAGKEAFEIEVEVKDVATLKPEAKHPVSAETKEVDERPSPAEVEPSVEASDPGEDEPAEPEEHDLNRPCSVAPEFNEVVLCNVDLIDHMTITEKAEFQSANLAAKSRILNQVFERVHGPGDTFERIDVLKCELVAQKFDERSHSKRATKMVDGGVYTDYTVRSTIVTDGLGDSAFLSFISFICLTLLKPFISAAIWLGLMDSRPYLARRELTKRWVVHADSVAEAMDAMYSMRDAQLDTSWQRMKSVCINHRSSNHPRDADAVSGAAMNMVHLLAAMFYTMHGVNPSNFQIRTATAFTGTQSGPLSVENCPTQNQIYGASVLGQKQEVWIQLPTALVLSCAGLAILVLTAATRPQFLAASASGWAVLVVLTTIDSWQDCASSCGGTSVRTTSLSLLTRICQSVLGWTALIIRLRASVNSWALRHVAAWVSDLILMAALICRAWIVSSRSSKPNPTERSSTRDSSTVDQTTPSWYTDLLRKLLRVLCIHAIITLSSMCLLGTDLLTWVVSCLGTASTWKVITAHLSLISLLTLCWFWKSSSIDTFWETFLSTTVSTLDRVKMYFDSSDRFLASIASFVVGVSTALMVYGCLARCLHPSETVSQISCSCSTLFTSEEYLTWSDLWKVMTDFSLFQDGIVTSSQRARILRGLDFMSSWKSTGASAMPHSADYFTTLRRTTSFGIPGTRYATLAGLINTIALMARGPASSSQSVSPFFTKLTGVRSWEHLRMNAALISEDISSELTRATGRAMNTARETLNGLRESAKGWRADSSDEFLAGVSLGVPTGNSWRSISVSVFVTRSSLRAISGFSFGNVEERKTRTFISSMTALLKTYSPRTRATLKKRLISSMHELCGSDKYSMGAAVHATQMLLAAFQDNYLDLATDLDDDVSSAVLDMTAILDGVLDEFSSLTTTAMHFNTTRVIFGPVLGFLWLARHTVSMMYWGLLEGLHFAIFGLNAFAVFFVLAEVIDPALRLLAVKIGINTFYLDKLYNVGFYVKLISRLASGGLQRLLGLLSVLPATAAWMPAYTEAAIAKYTETAVQWVFNCLRWALVKIAGPIGEDGIRENVKWVEGFVRAGILAAWNAIAVEGMRFFYRA